MRTSILERGYFTPNDSCTMGETDSASIQKAVDLALETGLGRVVIPKYNKRTGNYQWDVDKAIILDSNIEIVLDNCYIRQTDGSMDNVFRNFQMGKARRSLAQEQHDIIIRGVGKAVIDGGELNGLTEQTSMKDGRPHIYSNNVIFLHNLRDFKLENFTIINHRHWAINLMFAEKGIVSGLNLICDNTVRNQDGLDLRLGCNNIIVQNMTGQAGDDFIALSGFCNSNVIDRYLVEGKSMDIHDILIQNVMATSAECALIALRNHDGIKMYNITIDNVHDVVTSAETVKEGSFVFCFNNSKYKHSKSPYAILRVGQELFCTSRYCGPGDVHSIHVSNIHARCNNVIILNMDVENCYFGNIYAGEGVDCILSTTSHISEEVFGVDMRNTVFENIFYEAVENPDFVAFDFGLNTKEGTMENVVIRHAHLGDCSRVLNMEHQGDVHLEDICGHDIKGKISVRQGAVVTLDGQQV